MKGKRVGRPPRKDNPVAVRILLPAKLRHALKVAALMEGKPQGDVIAEALTFHLRRFAAGVKAFERAQGKS